MNTLTQWLIKTPDIPAAVTWTVAVIEHYRGRQDIAQQAPKALKAWQKRALFESAVASSRLESVEVPGRRLRKAVLGHGRLRKNLPDVELRGYRQALDLALQPGPKPSLNREAVQTPHRLLFPHAEDAGSYRAESGDVIERSPDGRRKVRTTTPTPRRVPKAVEDLLRAWNSGLAQKTIHPLLLLGAFNLDLLCIHPFGRGNGRVARLLLKRQLASLGHDIVQYVSIERLIEKHKDRYYESLRAGVKGWGTGKHDPWPYITFLLSMVEAAYREVETKGSQTQVRRGVKTAQILQTIIGFRGPFTIGMVQQACPEASKPLIRRLLQRERQAKRLKCLSSGLKAQWQVTRKK